MKSNAELLKQSNAMPINGKPKDRALVGLNNIEKFRNLIIKECMLIVSNSGNSKAEILNNLEEFLLNERLTNEV